MFPQGAGRYEELAALDGITLSWKIRFHRPGLERREQYCYLPLDLNSCLEIRIAHGKMDCAPSWASVLHSILLEDGILLEGNGDVLVNGDGASVVATIQVVAAVIDILTEKIDAAQEEAVLVVMVVAGVEARVAAGVASGKVEGSDRDDGSPAAYGGVDDVAPLVGADGQVVVQNQLVEAALEEGRDEDHHRMGSSKTACGSAVVVHEVHTARNVEGENDDRNIGTYVVWTQESQDFELH